MWRFSSFEELNSPRALEAFRQAMQSDESMLLQNACETSEVLADLTKNSLLNAERRAVCMNQAGIPGEASLFLLFLASVA